MHTLQCRAVIKAWRFGPVNRPVRHPSVFCLVDRTKTPRFDHNSTLQGVHIGQKKPFLVCI
ncbi:hypothetical protein HanIR_Chr15g0742531 [Helianthus annuus]|nr:hypothetical protein HanIR_Chr15g0742531 [Helianthus annuus]